MSILILLASAAFLGWIIFISYSRTIPAWMHSFFEHQRKIKFHVDKEGQEVSAVGLLQNSLILVSVVSLYLVLDGVGLGWATMTNAPVWFLAVLFLMIGLAWFVGRNLAAHWNDYRDVKNKVEAKDTLKAAYGVKEWAAGDEIRKRLDKGKAGDTVLGIHIGEGVHWNEKGHMLCVGGSGQGKGVNLVLPALLSEGLIEAGMSVVVLDPKGENVAVSAAHFKRNGYAVHVLNPFGIPEIAEFGNSRFNPFDLIDPSSNDAPKLYDMLAMALHNRKGAGENSFFDNRCRQYISLYMAYAQHIGKADFGTVYSWLITAGERRKTLLASMATDETFEGASTAEAISDRLTGEAARTEESIYTTIEEAINILKDKNLRDSLSASDFDLKTVAHQPTAIFVCVPFEELGYYAAWVRMFFSSLLRTLTKHYNVDHKVLVLLDEFPQLSYMDEVVRSLAVLRGYNVTLWPIVQSLAQLKKTYGEEWELFLSSAMVKHWLSNGADNFTADYITKRMPQALKFIGNNADGSPKEIQTKLLEHYDVINFPHMICELSGLDKPIKFKKIPYWDLPFSKDNASPNPFY